MNKWLDSKISFHAWTPHPFLFPHSFNQEEGHGATCWTNNALKRQDATSRFLYKVRYVLIIGFLWAAEWNNWDQDELLIQLAGYLRGQAFQEWNLLEQETYDTAVSTLSSRLDPERKAVAAQDFRHLTQKESENVSNFIHQLELTFQLAYGCDGMLPDALPL